MQVILWFNESHNTQSRKCDSSTLSSEEIN